MIVRRGPLLAAFALAAGSACAQDWLGGPLSAGCTDEPPPGLLLRVRAADSVSRTRTGWAYAYSVSNLADSRARVQHLVFQMPSPAFDPVPGWTVPDEKMLNAYARAGLRSAAASLATFDVDGRYEVKPGESLGVRAVSERLPGIVILRVYPRRQIPCIPTEEEEKALDAKGIRYDDLDTLADEATYTVGVPVLAPVFDAAELGEKGPEVLLASALDQLRALEPFLVMSYGARLKGFKSPVYDGRARGTAAPLEELRDQALRDVRPENREAVLRLYAFYSALKPAAATPTP